MPSDLSIASGLATDFADNNKHDGKTIFLIGSSILESTGERLLPLGAMAGVEIINLAKAGSYRKTLIHKDISIVDELAPTGAGCEEDLCVIFMLGNEMLTKKTFFHNRGTFHISHPRLLTDKEANLLVKDVTTVVEKLRDVGFSGKVLIIGPTPRHIEECCKQRQHSIRDAGGKEVAMLLYTNVLNEFLGKAINLPANVEFIPYNVVFGDNFGPGDLSDGVHLKEGGEMTLANFIFQSLSRPVTGEQRPLANRLPLSAMLAKEKVTAPVDEESDMEEEGLGGGEVEK